MQITARPRAVAMAAFALALALPAPATGQVKVRDHRQKKPAPQVVATGLSPSSGPVGTRVTITGRGFTPDTRVIFGRARVAPLKVTPTSILLRVPDAYGDGTVVLRHPGVGGDIAVGQFSVELPLAVTGFAPASGIPGTRVIVRGSGFRDGVEVRVGKAPAQVLRVAPSRITVVIPDGAGSGIIEVGAGSASARSARPFRVLSPAPSISGFTPAGGAPGAVVRITGSNLDASVTAHYGALPMTVAKRGPGWIDAVVPAGATASDHIWVRTSGGEARARVRFGLVPLPSIARLRPAYGVAGTRVDIYGSHFRAGDRFSIDGRPMRLLQLRPGHVRAVVPAGAAPAPIAVERDGYRATSPGRFDVVQPPQLLRFEPGLGQPGVRVTLVGRHLGADTEVRYGQRTLPIESRTVGKAGNDRLVVRIPRNADDRPFTVRTRGGTSSSEASFQVRHHPVVGAMEPALGMIGTELVVRGTNLDRVAEAHIGGHEIDIVKRKADRLVLRVTAGAKTATLVLVAYGQRFDTRKRFEVVATPRVTDLSPRSGVPGSEIVLSGHNFRKQTRVFLEGVELPVLRLVSDQLLTVMVPTGARSGRIFVGEGNARVPAPHPFVVLDAPTLEGFGPRKVHAGGNVTLRGRDFTRTTEVVWGAENLPVVARRGDRELVINVPRYLKPDKAPLVLRQDGVTVAASRRELEVLPEKKPGAVKIRDHRKKKKK